MKECFLKVFIALAGRRMLKRFGMVTQGLLLCLVATSIQSQEYPSRPIRMVVPSTSGITSDTLARLLGPRLSKKWGVAVEIGRAHV